MTPDPKLPTGNDTASLEPLHRLAHAEPGEGEGATMFEIAGGILIAVGILGVIAIVLEIADS